MPLTPRERVLAALHHEEPDRPPIVIGSIDSTTIKIKAPPTVRRRGRGQGAKQFYSFLYGVPSAAGMRDRPTNPASTIIVAT